MVDHLTNGPAVGAVGRVELRVAESLDGLAEEGGGFLQIAYGVGERRAGGLGADGISGGRSLRDCSGSGDPLQAWTPAPLSYQPMRSRNFVMCAAWWRQCQAYMGITRS